MSKPVDGPRGSIASAIGGGGPEEDESAAWGGDHQGLLQLLGAMNVGVSLRQVDPPTYLYANPRYYRIFGLDPAGPLPETALLSSRIHPDDANRVRAGSARAAQGQVIADEEFRIIRPDGAVRWLRATSGPVVDESGLVVRLASTIEDITDSKTAETLLVQSEDRFRQLVGSVNIGFTLLAIDPPDYLYASPDFFSILGHDPHGPAPTVADVLSHVHPDDLSQVRSAFAAANGGQHAEADLRIIRADAEQRWATVVASPVVDADGIVVRVAGTVEDITRRKTVEAALRESEKRFQQLAGNVASGFTLVDPTDPPEMIYANKGFLTILGLPPGSPLPGLAKLAEMVHPEDRERARDASLRLWQDKEVDLELRIIRADGEIRWTRNTRTPVTDEHGNVVRVAGMVEDITDRKTAEAAVRSARAEAERANMAKSEFLSRMSHELRTPLNAVLGFAQMLQLDTLSATQDDSVRQILHGGWHLLELINDVLDLSGIEAGRLEMSIDAVHVGLLLEATIVMMAPAAAAAGIGIVWDENDPQGDRSVRADERRLRQVLINVLSNAIKYNKPGGEVRVSCAINGGSDLDIIVTDTGFGVRPEDLPRLFTPFDRLGQQASGIEGSGIGLALSQRLVAIMAGRLEARSTLGKGSTFTITMPLADVAHPAAIGGEHPHDDNDTVTAVARSTLLYVEDNPANVDLLKAILNRRPGWTMVHTPRGGRGIELAGSSDPALVLLDLHLPDMNGIDVLHALRNDPRTAAIPVAVVSADANPQQIQLLHAAGALQYLTKPFRITELLELLDRHATPRCS